MASNIGSVGEFDVTKPKDWPTWKLKFTAWLAVNKIDNEDEINALLAVTGGELVDLLVSLCHPADVTTKDSDVLIKLIDNHYGAGRNKIAESYIFHCRLQKGTESVADYVVALRKLSVHCNFGSQWEQQMRNRLVSGVKDDKRKNRLLSESTKLTWDRAVEIGITADVQNNYTDMSRAANVGNDGMSVQKIDNDHSRGNFMARSRPSFKCFRCLGTNHQPHQCKYKDANCHHCNMKGHIKRACRKLQKVQGVEENHQHLMSPPQCQSRAPSASRYPFTHDQYYANQNSRDSEQLNSECFSSNPNNDCLSVRCVSGPHNQQITVDIDIESVTMPMEVDTGFWITLITSADYDRYFSKKSLKLCGLTFRSAFGDSVVILGKFEVRDNMATRCIGYVCE